LPRGQFLGFSNVGRALLESEEGEVPVRAWLNLRKRSAGPAQAARNRKLRSIVADSDLPMLSEWEVELFRVRWVVRPKPTSSDFLGATTPGAPRTGPCCPARRRPSSA